jgi:hypothetical protein
MADIWKIVWIAIGGFVGWFVGEFHPAFPLIIVAVAFILYDAWTDYQLDKSKPGTQRPCFIKGNYE